MRHLIKTIFSCFFLLLAICPQIAFAQMSSNNVEAGLISELDAAKPGDVFHIALVQQIAPDWHTYWRNPGDVGDATRIEWSIPTGITAGPIKWPTPNKIPYGDFVNYGYSGRVILPIEIKIPQNQAAGQIELKAKVSWLECKDICIPGSSELSIIIEVGGNTIQSANASEVRAAIASLPTPFIGSARIAYYPDVLRFGLAGDGAKSAESAYFFPYEIASGALINHAAQQVLEIGEHGLSLELKKSSSIPELLPDKIGGVIVIEKNGTQKSFEISAPFAEIMAGVSGQKPAVHANWKTLISAAFAAFLGGLILNLMPCVFPILAMKLFGLTKIAHADRQIARGYGTFYGLGVVATFVALGSIIYAIKSLGQTIGWGFQLQNPSFLFVMVLVISALGFNLLGLFEFSGLQNLGAAKASNNGNSGAFYSGALAVVVASPCTAPFMGSALGYAATQSPTIGMLVFVFLGLGFAFPFALLCFVPNLLKFLPKPGAWMERIKQILSIPMFLTAIWLIYVLEKVSGTLGVYLAIAAIGLLLLWIQLKQTAAKSVAATGFILVSAFTLYGFNFAFRTINISESQNSWSDAAVNNALAQGKTVFVNFTADWCITCKANEKFVLENQRVARAMSSDNVVYLVADWTNRNDEIARALSSHGRLGVPLYLIYKPNTVNPVVLPQILTPDTVIDGIG